jgi:hypothetical protein
MFIPFLEYNITYGKEHYGIYMYIWAYTLNFFGKNIGYVSHMPMDCPAPPQLRCTQIKEANRHMDN